ncbi:unnamed protein product [Schistosoma margrebowiei]|uniref:Uncharacterized protein n=1 Tax=Schistosoma margrebowiei TaxID=48269 RepID=A0A183N1L9_9TREM|nr:unnamed protein product [Schistosoma margrebowiei]
MDILDATRPSGLRRLPKPSIPCTQTKTTSVAEAPATLGLNGHKEKSKILKYNTENTNPVTVVKETLEEVETFTFLGSITDERGFDADVKARTGKVRAAFLQLKNI